MSIVWFRRIRLIGYTGPLLRAWAAAKCTSAVSRRVAPSRPM